MLTRPKNGKKADWTIFNPYLNIHRKDMTSQQISLADPEDIGLVEDAPPEAVEAYERYKEWRAPQKKRGIE